MSTSHQVLHYIIDAAPEQQHFVLRIWEPAPTGRKPYLYQLNYKLASEEAARQVLNQHLMLMGGQPFHDSQPLPPQGEVEVHSEPTVTLSLP